MFELDKLQYFQNSVMMISMIQVYKRYVGNGALDWALPIEIFHYPVLSAIYWGLIICGGIGLVMDAKCIYTGYRMSNVPLSQLIRDGIALKKQFARLLLPILGTQKPSRVNFISKREKEDLPEPKQFLEQITREHYQTYRSLLGKQDSPISLDTQMGSDILKFTEKILPAFNKIPIFTPQVGIGLSLAGFAAIYHYYGSAILPCFVFTLGWAGISIWILFRAYRYRKQGEIFFFQRDRVSHQVNRIKAILVNLEDFQVILRFKNHIYEIPSKYRLPELLCGNTLRAVLSEVDEHGTLAPLNPVEMKSTGLPSPELDTQLSSEERQRYIAVHPKVQHLGQRIAQYKQLIREELARIQRHQEDQEDFIPF